MTHIAVIGGGIIGTSVAHHLQSRGHSVMLFEQGQLGSGATADSIAQFTYHQDDPDETNQLLRHRSWDWYESRIAANQLSFEQTGTLQTACTPENVAAVRSLRDDLSSLGVDAEWLSPEEVDRYDLKPDSTGGALYLPEDGVLDPTEILQYHVDELDETSLQTGTTVTDITVSNGSVDGVLTTDGHYSADVVVNAAGPWADRLSETVDVPLPIRHTMGPILVLQADSPVSLPLTFFEEGIYLRREGQCQVLAGQMDTSYENAKRYNPDEAKTPGESFSLAVGDVVDRYVSGVDEFKVVNDWLGLRTVTPDGLPLVDDTSVAGYIVACGMNGFGITHAPAVGMAVADRLAGKQTDLVTALSLDRFDN